MVEVVVVLMLGVTFVAFLLPFLGEFLLPHSVILALLSLPLDLSPHQVVGSLLVVLLLLLLSSQLLLLTPLHPLGDLLLLLLHSSLLPVEVLFLHHSEAFVRVISPLHLVELELLADNGRAGLTEELWLRLVLLIGHHLLAVGTLHGELVWLLLVRLDRVLVHMLPLRLSNLGLLLDLLLPTMFGAHRPDVGASLRLLRNVYLDEVKLLLVVSWVPWRRWVPLGLVVVLSGHHAVSVDSAAFLRLHILEVPWQDLVGVSLELSLPVLILVQELVPVLLRSGSFVFGLLLPVRVQI